MKVSACLGLFVLCLVVSACGSSARVDSHSPPPRVAPPSPIALRFTAASNREFARDDVEKLLRLVVLPRSARQVPKVPKSAPSWFRSELSSGLRGSVVAHRTWIVNRPVKEVVRYLRAHAPSRPRPESSPFRTSTDRIGARANENLLFHPTPGRSWSRWLNIAMLRLPGGATVVTAQAGDSWIKPPPRSAELTGKVKQVDITSGYVDQRPRVRLHVHDRYLVASLVSWMNGLGTDTQYAPCLYIHADISRPALGFAYEPTITLRFRDARGTPLAHATVGGGYGGFANSGPCNPLTLTVSGQKPRRLIAADLVERIEKRLNADLDPPLRSNVSRCLKQRGWRVRPASSGLVVRKDGASSTITFLTTGKVTITGSQRPAIASCLRYKPYFLQFG